MLKHLVPGQEIVRKISSCQKVYVAYAKNDEQHYSIWLVYMQE